MMNTPTHPMRTQKPGTTLVELLLFIGIIALVVAIAMPILYSSTENRILQQTIAVVEQNGAQVLQNMSLRIRNAEKILSPPAGQTGSYLALQASSGALSPVIIGVWSGSIIVITHATREVASSTQVAVQDFVVRNTSTAERGSAVISFTMSRTIRLQQPHRYQQWFQTTALLLPHDEETGNACACLPPSCQAIGEVGWQICEEGTCSTVETPLECP